MTELAAWRYEDEEWRGFVLQEDRTALLFDHVFVTWLAAFHHFSDEARDPSFKPGQPLALVPEPDNPHDPNAIVVFNADRTLQAGYVPRAVTSKITSASEGRVGLVLAELLEAGERKGLDIVVSRQPVSIRVLGSPDGDEARHIRQVVRVSKRRFARAESLLQKGPPGDPVEQMWRMLEEKSDG